MKAKVLFIAILFSICWSSHAQVKVWQETDGYVLLEAENVQYLNKGWELFTDVSGYSGSGSVKFVLTTDQSGTGMNYEKASPDKILTYYVNITREGVYRINMVNYHTMTDGDNDLWVSYNHSDWVKQFDANAKEWTWNDNQPGFSTFFKPGINKLQLAGRSRGFTVDKIVLYHEDLIPADWDDLSNVSWAHAAESSVQTISDQIPPDTPRGLRDFQTGSDKISLIWDIPGEDYYIEGYTLFMDGNQLNDKLLHSNMFSITDLTPEKEYTFRIKAVDWQGNETPLSESVSIRTIKISDDFGLGSNLSILKGNELVVAEDVFVRGGSYSETVLNDGYIMATNRVESQGGDMGNLFVSYLKFDLRDLVIDEIDYVKHARLQLIISVLTYLQGEEHEIRVYQVKDDWKETEITFNNAPDLSIGSGIFVDNKILSHDDFSSDDTLQIDISGFVKEELINGDSILSFNIYPGKEDGVKQGEYPNWEMLGFYDKDSNNQLYKDKAPKIIYLTDDDQVNSAGVAIYPDNSLRIYPLPFIDELHFDGCDMIKSFRIYDLSGRLLDSRNFTRTINLSHLGKGSYIIRLKSDSGEVISRRIIK